MCKPGDVNHHYGKMTRISKIVRDGEVLQSMPMDEARKIAERVGVLMPAIRSRVEP